MNVNADQMRRHAVLAVVVEVLAIAAVVTGLVVLGVTTLA